MAKKRVQCLNGALCFVSSSVLADNFVLRNPLLRQAPNRYWQPQTEENMRTKIRFVLLVLFISNFSFAQNREPQFLSDVEQNLINDLTYTFKDTSISFILSPFINYSIDTSMLDLNFLTNKYGFLVKDIEKDRKDTLLLTQNDFFQIMNQDSLIKYRKIEINESLDDPVLDEIEKYYNKLGICSFHHIVFSKNKDYALVEYYMHCGFLCGFGEVVLMKRKDKHWIRLETLVINES